MKTTIPANDNLFKMTVTELQDDYDWIEAFAYATPDTLDGTLCYPFKITDVSHIEASIEGENDGDNWLILGQLEDGRWFYLSAGCDFTGWDCQASGRAYVGATKDAMFIHIDAYDANRLGITL